MKQFMRFMKGDNIRRRVTYFTLILLLSLITGYVSFFFITLEFSKNFSAMFNRSLELKAMSLSLETFEHHLETYLNTKDSDSFIAYLDQYNQLTEKQQAFDQGLSYDEDDLLVNNISMILDTYLEHSQKAIEYKRARNTGKYVQTFNDIKRLSGYINEIIDEINALEFSDNLDDYVIMSEKIENLKVAFLMMTVGIIALSIVFIYDFTRKLTKPIEVLSEYAYEISRGNYDLPPNHKKYYQEADLLANTFSDMALSIQTYVAELKGKVETENKLRLTETENLKIQNLLKQAELTALQSQINPHFLFNTLNAGVQLANLEDAERTSEFLDNLSNMFRYNIQSLDNTVTLKDELVNVQNYYHLMKVRFGDYLKLYFETDDSVEHMMMPPLILQPIIENSLIHGFEDKEDTGVVEIAVKKSDRGAMITIKDNGKGIHEDRLRRLIDNQFDMDEDEDHKGHTTGLGLSNVYQRLKNFYGIEDVLDMESKAGEYTQITVHIVAAD